MLDKMQVNLQREISPEILQTPAVANERQLGQYPGINHDHKELSEIQKPLIRQSTTSLNVVNKESGG